jgi:Coenzyme PQQ synthesis protein D (PqqD)
MEKPGAQGSVRISDMVRGISNQDGAVLLDIEQGLCFSMNPVGARIWELLKQGCTPVAIIDNLEKEFDGVARSQLEMDVTDFLNELHTRRLITTAQEQQPKRSALSRLFRRSNSA